MQILPTVSTMTNQEMSAKDQLKAAINQSIALFGSKFADSLNMAESNLSLQAQPQTAESTLTMQEETEEEEKDERDSDSVYSRSASQPQSFTIDEVCFTQTELTNLLSGLKKNKAPQKSLKALSKLCELPDGANLGQVLASLKGKKEEISLSDEDANNITNLTNSIDPSGMLERTVLDAIYNNKPDTALRALTNALDELDPGEMISVSKDDVLSFGRGLGLGQESLERLESFFGDAQNGTTTPAGFKKLLSPAQDEILNAKKDEESLNTAIEKTLGPMLDKAKKRMEEERNSQTLKSRESEQSKTYIDKTVQEESRLTLNNILDEGYYDHEPPSLEESMRQASAIPSMQNPAGQSFSGTPQNFTGSDSRGKQGENPWNELLGKVKMQTSQQGAPLAAPAQGQGMPHPAAFSPTPVMNQANLAASGPGQDARQNLPIARQVAAQVEEGLFQTLRNGSSRLELQLHPQDLGSVAITLIARGGEVSAHIKTDRAETAELLSQQADSIRAKLEEQGIKVDNIEIELKDESQNEKNEQQLLQDMEQHNSFQEEDARRQQLRRMRTLAAINNSAGREDSQKLEQSVQRKDDQETSSTRILDRVA
ncbi:MAG: flagellar hook-length control protein FliK [Desulfovibrio sp.]|nr:flagellar hook-length control protein FliK [Desulfovibrio sp.]